MLFNDIPSEMRREVAGIKALSPLWVLRGYGKKYYLNEQLDRACADAPDSDQDMETDDGVSAEEVAEISVKAPLAVSDETSGHNSPPGSVRENEAGKFFRDSHPQQAMAVEQWDNFWSTRETRQVSKELVVPGTFISALKRKRSKLERHSTPMTFETWREGGERAEANSFALPVNVSSDAGPLTVDHSRKAPVQCMNKTMRDHAQRLYLEEDNAVESPPESSVTERIAWCEKKMHEKAHVMPSYQITEKYAPGYGILPKNASFMFDATRQGPKTGYGLGERDRGGLWLADKDPNEFFGGSGYITVSDSEDEEEESRGWKRQMQADARIEREWRK
jgi:hypothetical protein